MGEVCLHTPHAGAGAGAGAHRSGGCRPWSQYSEAGACQGSICLGNSLDSVGANRSGDVLGSIDGEVLEDGLGNMVGLDNGAGMWV